MRTKLSYWTEFHHGENEFISMFIGLLLLSKTISMSCSMLVNYFLNKFWSFSARHKKNQYELLRFAATQMANMFANVSVNAIIFSATQIKSLAFIIATGVAFCVNYVLQRFWVRSTKSRKFQVLKCLLGNL